jgi:Mrp family chromosome partitioning ATPase
MARMLQALKNLEARSKSTAAKGWLAHLADKPQHAQPRTPLALAEVEREPAPPVVPPPAILVRPVRKPAAELSPGAVQPALDERRQVEGKSREAVETAGESTPPPAASRQAGPEPISRGNGSPECLPHGEASGRKPGSLERQVQRMLGDSERSQPLVQLADRLRREAEQSASKTLMLVGVGAHSATHEMVVQIAALLAQRHGERVLLIDADLARSALSLGLEQGQASGLAEGLRSNKPLRDRCQATALAGVSVLPAGRGQSADLLAEPHRLEEILREAAGQFSLVLVDGGRSVDRSAGLLGRLADLVYFVVQLGEVETSEAVRALAEFRAASARVAGCIAT